MVELIKCSHAAAGGGERGRAPGAGGAAELGGRLLLDKAVFQGKGKGNGGVSERYRGSEFEEFFEFDGTKLKQFPIPSGSALAWAQRLDSSARELADNLPAAVTGRQVPTRDALDVGRTKGEATGIRPLWSAGPAGTTCDARRPWPPPTNSAELVPRLMQWHNDIDPATGLRLGDFFADFVATESAAHGISPDDLAAWRPPARVTRRTR